MRKPCVKQRISTNIARACHPDCEEALQRLCRTPVALEELEQEVNAQVELEAVELAVEVDINIDFDFNELAEILNDVNLFVDE